MWSDAALDDQALVRPFNLMRSPPNIGHPDWLNNPSTQAVLTALSNGGFCARAVGGAVRNTLMALPVNDVDIATDARPEDVCRLMGAAGLAVHETGLKHGTVTVVSNNDPFEVTTLRTDVTTDGRHATVAFTTDWHADAARRDFTINALYCDADGTVFDPLDGYSDVIAQRVRFIGDATSRIREDYLRILRFFRFSAIFGNGALDQVGLDAVTAEQSGLDGISAERIWSELHKTLMSKHVVPVIDAMARSGVLERVLGQPVDMARWRNLVAAERRLAVTADGIRALAALLVSHSASVQHLAQRLRLSNNERAQLRQCGEAVTTDLSSPRHIREAIYRFGQTAVRDCALLQAADRGDDETARMSLAISDDWTVPKFPVSGADLMALGCEPGPDIGATLRALEEVWIASDFTLSREQLLAERD